MPQQIAELPKTARGRAKKYDFSGLYDGNAWVIVSGEDFDCEVQSIRQLIYREVADLGKSVKSTATTVGEGEAQRDALAFQVVDEPPRKRTVKADGDGKPEAKEKHPEAAKETAKPEPAKK